MAELGDSDLFRILIASDCHLGFMEKDEVRRDDSFLAFEEICRTAKEREVDFILFGGDLFHENKPSRATLVKTIEILRRYCLSDKPVQFQVVSDQTVNFPDFFGRVNYEDPHFNVGLPVFTIHGNHDDPAGVDNLSAIDILSSCNLVNYFGKTVLKGSGVGQISLHPILLQKGNTRISLYGLGNIRDERLNRMFQTPHSIQWVRPEVREDSKSSDWFNIFVLHQNRVKSNAKNAVSEHFLARFLDFVIWGHEHECLVDPQEVVGMGFHVTQPGSTVATSLIDGESRQKHVLLLEVKGNQYRPTKVPITCVRPFVYRDVSLRDSSCVDPSDPSALVSFLDRQVCAMIEEAASKRAASQPAMLPLIRIRVDYTGFSTVNPQRFGQKFVGKVANPNDILLFTKSSGRKKQGVSEQGDGADTDRLRPEELNQQNIEALLTEADLKMELLPMQALGTALHEFVNKDDKQAFHACLKSTLEDMQFKLLKDGSEQTELQDSDILQKVIQITQRRESQAGLGNPRGMGGSAQEAARPASLISDLFSSEFGEVGDVASTPATNKEQLGGGRGRGRGRNTEPAVQKRRAVKGSSSTLKQTTLSLAPRQKPSQRAAASEAAARLQAQREDAGEEDIESDSSHSDAGRDLESEFNDEDEQEEEEKEGESEEAHESAAIKRSRGRRQGAALSRPQGLQAVSSAKFRKRGSESGSMQGTFVEDDDAEEEAEAPAKRRRGLRGTATQSPSKGSQVSKRWGSLRK